MVWPSSKNEGAAQTGAAIGAKLGSKAGPLGDGIGAGFGGATGYVAGSFLPECPARKVLPDGSQRVEDGAGDRRATVIPVEEE